MFCTGCGREIDDNAVICVHCGIATNNTNAQQQQPQAPQYGYQAPPVYNAQPIYGEQKSKMAAGLLQIFLGSFGVGRFYLGYAGIGVAQILVTWLTCGIGAVWPLIDGIMILTGSVKTDANGVPLKD